MVVVRFSNAALLLCCALASGCAARDSKPAYPDANAQAELAATRRDRELTWGQYYAGVRERAFRRGAMVVWVNPPQVRKPKLAAAPESGQ
jgi:hypothetical protein